MRLNGWLVELGWNRVVPPVSFRAVYEGIRTGLDVVGREGNSYGDGVAGPQILADLQSGGSAGSESTGLPLALLARFLSSELNSHDRGGPMASSIQLFRSHIALGALAGLTALGALVDHPSREARLLVATGAGAAFASASTTIQGDYFVATNGSDSNPGTITQPFRTIAKGVSMLTPGKTLLVRSGTYAESLQDTIPGGTSWSSPVTVAAYPGDTVTIQPSSGASRALSFTGARKQYIIVQGFRIDARNVTHRCRQDH